MNFNNKYKSIVSDLNLVVEQDQELEQANIQPIIDDEKETTSVSSTEISDLDNAEIASRDVMWVEKIIKLLTLLNKESQNVKNLIQSLTDKDTNADTLNYKNQIIDELLQTTNPDSIVP